MNKWLLRYIIYKYDYYKIWVGYEASLEEKLLDLLHHIEYTSYDMGYYEATYETWDN